MNFLEARKIAVTVTDKNQWRFLLGLSGTADPLLVYIAAHAAADGRNAAPRTLPFGTLQQALLSPATPGEREVFLLCPWDFAPALDWRSGIPAAATKVDDLVREAESVAEQIRRRGDAAFVYLPAPIPPLFDRLEDGDRIAANIALLAQQIGARFLDADCFSLASYFSSGCPIRSTRLSDAASVLVDALLGKDGPAKVLVTDLDETVWSGVLGDVGPEGIDFRPEGRGYRHYFYQTLLRQLRNSGALLAVVSRSDPETMRAGLTRRDMILSEDDFVALLISYQPKSAQIRALAERINLGLDAFVFVDDNPVEIAEVNAALPQVRCIRFPEHEDGLIPFTAELHRLFRRNVTTHEDRERTAMYRRRLEGIAPTDADGASIVDFLRGLGMRLVITDRAHGERARAVQLINKTNQFNINGRRWSENEIAALLDGGGHLFGATLIDRAGSHGEILSCLIDRDGTVRAFVLSCRVFQRRVEYAFLHWLCQKLPGRKISFDYVSTPKNIPARQFFDDGAFSAEAGGKIHVNHEAFISDHAGDRETVQVELTPP